MQGLLMPIGDRLKKLRTAKGLTQLDLSKASGLSLSIITQIEQGSTADPKLSTLRALAKGLNVTVDELIDNGDQTEPAPLPEPDEPPAQKKGRRPKGK